MIKLEIAIPKKEGLKNWEINSLVDFMEDINFDDMVILLEGSKIISKGSKKYPLEIIIERRIKNV